MKNSLNEIDFNVSALTDNYMPRPRIDDIFNKVTRCKLVYVIAGAGYGKTQAVYNYVKQQENAVVRWVQLTESDNIGSRYWESLTHNISLDNPDLANRLCELGFPETLARFKQFTEIIKTTEHRSNKTFLVLDDFHLIHSKQALIFAERCAHLNIPGACVIIISRKEPEINTVSLFSKGKAGRITEEELRFTDIEVSDFLHLHDIPFSAKNLPQYIEATNGWALAIKLLSLTLKRIPQNLALALDSMKQNIFKLFETEAWNDFPESVKKTIVKLSLVSDLPLIQLRKIFEDVSLEKYMPQLSSFIWHDTFINDYRIHPLYFEFVKGKQPILSEDEKQETYRLAAQWCSENSFYTDSMMFYAKSHQYDRMCKTLLSYPFRLPHETGEYFLRILESIDPDNKEKNNESILLLKNFFIPLLMTGIGNYEEAGKRCLSIIQRLENNDSPFSLYLLHTAYSNLFHINMYTCTVTHQYDFPKHLKKSVEYFKKSSLSPIKTAEVFAVPDIRSYACAVGEDADLPEFDQYLEAMKESALYIKHTPLHMYYGYAELVACELAFYKNQRKIAKNHAHNTILKAREKKQHSIEIIAEQYLLRLAIRDGNVSLVKELVKQLQNHLTNPDFWNRQLLYDLIIGFFYSQIGLVGQVPVWFDMDEKETASEVHIPVSELIVRAKYYIACNKYEQALAVLNESYPREPQHRSLFGELSLSLLTAIAKNNTGDNLGAMADFEKAYNLSFCGEFEMFFIELGKEMRSLIIAALKHNNCGIPEKWLKTIYRNTSVYMKNSVIIKNAFNNKENAKDSNLLSEREREVLSDLYHGLTRDDIATNRYISINTVNKILQSVFYKLDAEKSIDAIRVALENKMIE